MKAVLALVLLAACGDDGGSGMPDAPKQVDAPAAAKTVMEVDCTGVVANAMVMTTDLASSYAPPASSIAVGGIVKFVTSLSHDVAPNPIAPQSDAGLVVGFNKTGCLKFTASGTFGFLCSNHGFTGTITVN